MPEPWYRDGLQFECTRCGDCCTGPPGYVFVTPEETAAIASFLGMPAPDLEARHLRQVGERKSLLERANGDCIFFNRGCAIYPHRPAQCRTFPFWDNLLSSPESWERAAGKCPGIGGGRLYPPEAIERLKSGEGETL